MPIPAALLLSSWCTKIPLNTPLANRKELVPVALDGAGKQKHWTRPELLEEAREEGSGLVHILRECVVTVLRACARKTHSRQKTKVHQILITTASAVGATVSK